MENTEMIYALAEPKQSKIVTKMRNLMTGVTALSAVTGMAATQAFADAPAGDDWTGGISQVTTGEMGNSSSMMAKIIGILLTISQYVGVALIIYGVYEVIMSFMQNQPEAKTKGIVMALAGAVMTGLKSILVGIGVVK